MRSKDHGLMAKLLMFIPLLAVPFVASFGVPWLAAKAKDEGLPAPDLPSPSLLGTGVGQSNTTRHSVEDLFAPLDTEAVVDLRMAPGSPSAAAQNPHLRNASLVVSHNEAWIDPFETFNASPQSQVEAAANPTNSSPQTALEDWMLKEDSAEFGPPEAPTPQEFSHPPMEETLQRASNNPFAGLEGASHSNAEAKGVQVAVEDGAFEDPIPEPRVNRGRNSFDASRTLFIPSESPSVPRRAVERQPAASPPAKVGANVANTINDSPQPLTWETARDRLKALGIKDYYLQPEPAGQLYLFRCAYTPPDNPRISRLFEAEAADPLEAVRKVLAQVETWTIRQSVSGN